MALTEKRATKHGAEDTLRWRHALLKTRRFAPEDTLRCRNGERQEADKRNDNNVINVVNDINVFFIKDRESSIQDPTIITFCQLVSSWLLALWRYNRICRLTNSSARNAEKNSKNSPAFRVRVRLNAQSAKVLRFARFSPRYRWEAPKAVPAAIPAVPRAVVRAELLNN